MSLPLTHPSPPPNPLLGPSLPCHPLSWTHPITPCLIAHPIPSFPHQCPVPAQSTPCPVPAPPPQLLCSNVYDVVDTHLAVTQEDNLVQLISSMCRQTTVWDCATTLLLTEWPQQINSIPYLCTSYFALVGNQGNMLFMTSRKFIKDGK